MTAPAERILVVGVDGGGSKTRAVVADATGRTLATVDGPGSAVRPGEAARSADVIAAVVRDALAAVLASGFAVDEPRDADAIVRDDAAVAATGSEPGDVAANDEEVAAASSAEAPELQAATDEATSDEATSDDATSDEDSRDAPVAPEQVAAPTADAMAETIGNVAQDVAGDDAVVDAASDRATDADAAHDVEATADTSDAGATDELAGEGSDVGTADAAVAHAADAADEAFPAPLLVPAVLYVGVAGAGRESEREALRLALAARGLADEVIVVPDAEIALDDAFGEGPGVMLIAGTGSVAFARGPSGEFRRAGGWGPVIGDEGSGAWIGRRAVNVAAASADGREPATALLDALLTAIDADDPAALIPWAAEATPARFAELAPVVLRVAANGDLRANTLLSMAIEELVLHVRTLARGLFVDERAAVPVALAGGLLAPRQPLRKRLEQRLRTAVPGAQLRQDEIQPARGAVRAALRQLGVEV